VPIERGDPRSAVSADHSPWGLGYPHDVRRFWCTGTVEGSSVKTIGRHLIAEFYECDPNVLNDVDRVRTFMLTAARKVGATIVGEAFHHFSPQGVSGSVVISESHLSIHTWPEKGYVAVDIFTCGGLDPRPGFRYLAESLGAKSSRLQEILRGIPEDLVEHDLILPEDVQVITRTGTLQETEPVPVEAGS